MTAPEQVASTAQQQAGAVAGTAKEQAASVAHTATSAAGEVTGTAKEQVGSVVGETVAQAKDLTGQVKQQAAQQVSSQTDKATTALRELSKQLSEGDTSGVVGTVLTEVGNRVQGLADVLEQKGPQGLLEDVRLYARRNPGTFMLGAALAGLVTGRLVKGMQAPEQQLALPPGPSATPAPVTTPTGLTGTAAGDPLSGISTSGLADEAVVGGTYSAGTTYGAPSTTPAYPSSGSPYSAGYGQTEPYGSRGTL